MRIFLNRHGEIRCGWSAAAALLFMLIAQTIVIVLILLISTMIGIFGSLPPDLLVQIMEILSELAIFAAIVLLFRLLYKRPLSQMGLSMKGFAGDFIAGVIMGAVCISAVALATIALGYGKARWVGFTMDNTRYIILNCVLHLTVGLAEETLARGYLMTAFKTTRQKWLIVASSGIIFGLLHLGNPGVTLFSVINIALIGFAFAFMFVKRGNIWMPVGFHFIWNFLQGSLYGSAVSGGEAVSLIHLTQEGPDLFTGGDFGFEGGIFTTIVTILCTLAVLLLCPKKENPQWTLDSDLPLNRIMVKPAASDM